MNFFKKKPIQSKKPLMVTNPKLFCNIILSLSDKVGIDLLKSYDWEIEDLGKHHYHVTGSHPILMRIDYYNYFFISHS